MRLLIFFAVNVEQNYPLFKIAPEAAKAALLDLLDHH